MDIDFNKNEIITEEFLKDLPKNLIKIESKKIPIIGLEYKDYPIRNDNDLCAEIRNNMLINSIDISLEFETFMVARVKRYCKRDKSYTPEKFLKKMITSSINYLEHDAMLFQFDFNAKRIVIELVLDIFRLAMTHEKYPKISKDIVNLSKKLLKILLQSHYWPSTVLILK